MRCLALLQLLHLLEKSGASRAPSSARRPGRHVSVEVPAARWVSTRADRVMACWWVYTASTPSTTNRHARARTGPSRARPSPSRAWQCKVAWQAQRAVQRTGGVLEARLRAAALFRDTSAHPERPGPCALNDIQGEETNKVPTEEARHKRRRGGTARGVRGARGPARRPG